MSTAHPGSQRDPSYQQRGYALVREAIPRNTCAALVRRLWQRGCEGDLRYGDKQVARCLSGYALAEVDMLLLSMQSLVSQVVGRALLPTYGFARIYLPGAVLKTHTDREACEVSATISLGHEAGEVWPLFIRDLENTERRIQTDAGDLIVYQGSRLPHWRRRLGGGTESWRMQAFLHYVIADGPRRDLRFDRRPGLTGPDLLSGRRASAS